MDKMEQKKMNSSLRSSLGARVSLVAITLSLTGCAEYQLRKLDGMQPVGTEFNKELTKEYRCFALREQRVHADFWDVRHFAVKAQKSAGGEDVLPEKPTDWDIEKSVLPEVQKAYKRLVSALDCKGREKAPQYAAAAQRYFDEWIEQLEERWQTDHIQAARMNFYENLRKMEEVICPLKGAPKFKVHYGLGKYNIKGKMESEINSAVASAKENCHCKVFVTGNTDASGSRKFNLELSKKRAHEVEGQLSQNGIKEKRIVARGKGEVPGSARYDKKNRKVEILIH